MTEIVAENCPDTTQDQPEQLTFGDKPTSNADPPEDVSSQINELYSRFDEYAKKVKPKLDDAGLRDFATETSNVDVAHGQAQNRKDPGHLRTAINAAKTNIDRLLPADSVEFTETETAQEAGNSADVVEDVHQEDDPVEVSPYPDQNPIHDKAVQSLLNVVIDRISHGELPAAPEAIEALAVRVREVLAPEPDWDELSEQFLNALSERKHELALPHGEDLINALRKFVDGSGTLDDVPFGEHDAERPPTDEELDAPDPPPDPILVIEHTDKIVVAHGRNTMIYGKPGGGKTWLALLITIMVAHSGGRVVYYNWDQSTEKGNKKLWRRLMQLKYWRPEYRDNIRIIAAKQFTPELLAERREKANEWLLAGNCPEQSLVVIDTISNAGGALNNGRDYKAWAEVHIKPHSSQDISTLGLAHEAKTDPNGPFGSVLSLADCDTAIRAVCIGRQSMFNKHQTGEFTLILDKDREGDSATPEGAPVAIIEGDPSAGFLDLRCKPPTSRVEQMLNDSTGPRDLRGDIIELIKANGGTYTKSFDLFRDELECNAGALRTALKGLVDEEVLDKVRDGRSHHYMLIGD